MGGRSLPKRDGEVDPGADIFEPAWLFASGASVGRQVPTWSTDDEPEVCFVPVRVREVTSPFRCYKELYDALFLHCCDL